MPWVGRLLEFLKKADATFYQPIYKNINCAQKIGYENTLYLYASRINDIWWVFYLKSEVWVNEIKLLYKYPLSSISLEHI